MLIIMFSSSLGSLITLMHHYIEQGCDRIQIKSKVNDNL